MSSSGRSSTSGARALSMGRPDRALRYHVDGDLRADSVPLRQHEAFGEGYHLHGETDIDCVLDPETLAVLTDACRRPELAEDRLDEVVRVGVPANHHRERARLHLRDVASHGRVEHGRSLFASP